MNIDFSVINSIYDESKVREHMVKIDNLNNDDLRDLVAELIKLYHQVKRNVKLSLYRGLEMSSDSIESNDLSSKFLEVSQINSLKNARRSDLLEISTQLKRLILSNQRILDQIDVQ